MYKSKDKGRNQYTFFEKKMNISILERIEMQTNLKNAVKMNEFTLHYQPQVDIQQGKIKGFEALIRWNSPSFGTVSPDRFIPHAEESGLIVPIGDWVMRTSCIFAKKLIEQGYNEIYVSVNVSVIQIMQHDFIEKILKIINEIGIPPHNLGLEITESLLMESFEANMKKLKFLKDKGVRISLDDFGKGYSSLTYLKTLPVTNIKIDKAFIDDIESQDLENCITGSIILLAHKLGYRVVAEGVETIGQYKYLENYGCDTIQGYLFSKPVVEKEALNLLKKGNLIIKI